jgi:thiol:disulfide interchange protein DsbC
MKTLSQRIIGVVLGALICIAAPVQANPDVVKQAVEAWLKGRYKVDEIRKTPLAGMYEVRFGNDLIYVDEKGQYAFLEGVMFDMKNDKNLTSERKDDIMRVDFKTLPLDLALKQVSGNGKRQLVVFEDPNCGHCRNMRRELLTLENTTLYTYTLPILSPDSAARVKQVWCSPNKNQAWNDLMLSNKVPSSKADCATPVAKIVALGQKLSVTGTPTLIFTSGRRVPGSVPLAQVRKYLEEN